MLKLILAIEEDHKDSSCYSQDEQLGEREVQEMHSITPPSPIGSLARTVRPAVGWWRSGLGSSHRGCMPWSATLRYGYRRLLCTRECCCRQRRAINCNVIPR